MPRNDDTSVRDEDDTETQRPVRLSHISRVYHLYMEKICLTYPLFLALLLLFGIYWTLVYTLGKASYTATAIIGPPNPSPVSSLLNSMPGSGRISGIARQITGGGGGGSNDPYQEYQQILLSTRLPIELAKKNDFLQESYRDRWDAVHNRWNPPGALFYIVSPIKRFLDRPVSDHPDAVSLMNYLDRNFDVTPTKSVGAGITTGVMQLQNGFLTLTFEADDPERAQSLLSTLMTQADDLIRQEQMKDIDARISFINAELLRTSQSDLKDALIQTLALQENIKVMMIADKRFAYILVDPPYASPIPTSPIGPSKALLVSIVLSLFLGTVIIVLADYTLAVRKLVSRFEVRKRNP